MTKRVVSLMGVAAVATMVILAGCSSGPGAAPAEADHTAALAGIWTVETTATVPYPAADPPTIDVLAAVSVTIVDGPGVNTGSFVLTVTIPSPLGPQGPPVVTTGSGMLTAESDSVLKVTLDEIMGAAPANVTALKGVELTVNYELMDDMLKISSELLPELGVAMELTLEKQMASSSRR